MNNIVDDFVKDTQMSFMQLWYSINNQLKKASPDLTFIDMRTDACIVLVLLEVLKQHNRRMDELIASKLGEEFPISSPHIPIHNALKMHMKAFIGHAKFEFTEQVKISMKILHKNFKRIEYSIK